MNWLLLIIVPGCAVILVACVYAGNGPATLTVNRYIELDSNISAAVAPASAPSAPVKGK